MGVLFAWGVVLGYLVEEWVLQVKLRKGKGLCEMLLTMTGSSFVVPWRLQWIRPSRRPNTAAQPFVALVADRDVITPPRIRPVESIAAGQQYRGGSCLGSLEA